MPLSYGDLCCNEGRLRVLVVAVAAAVLVPAAFASFATAAQTQVAKPPRGCPAVRPHHGKRSADWEAVFGWRRKHSDAVALLGKVRRHGFRCAVIENERHTHEVAVIALHRQSSAVRIVMLAHEKGLPARVAQS